MPVPQSTSRPRSSLKPKPRNLDQQVPIGRSPLAPESSAAVSPSRAGFAAEAERRRIEAVQHQLEMERRRDQEFGVMGGGKGGDQPRDQTIESYFPVQPLTPRKSSSPPSPTRHAQQPSADGGAFAAMLSASPSGLESDEDEEDDYRPRAVNPTTGMRLPRLDPPAEVHSPGGRGRPADASFPSVEPKRSLSPPPVGSVHPQAPAPLYPSSPTGTKERARVEYQLGSPRDRRGSGATQQEQARAALTSPSVSSLRDPHDPFRNPPNQQQQTRGPQPTSAAAGLSIQTTNLGSPSAPFASPYSSAPPSPALAWGPEQSGKTLLAKPDRKVQMEEKVLIRGRDRGEDRTSKFWNRFSMVVHKDAGKEEAAWLKKQNGSNKKYRMWGWISFITIVVIVGAVLAWHFTHKDPEENKNLLTGAFETVSLPPTPSSSASASASATKAAVIRRDFFAAEGEAFNAELAAMFADSPEVNAYAAAAAAAPTAPPNARKWRLTSLD